MSKPLEGIKIIDFTHVPGGQDEAGAALARRLQAAIHAATGLTC